MRPSGLSRRAGLAALALIGALVLVIAALLYPRLRPLPGGLLRPVVATPKDLADGRSLGAPNAPLLWVAWFDFSGGRSPAFYRTYLPMLVDRYVSPGYARLLLKDFASTPEAARVAVAARCATPSGHLFDFLDLLAANAADVSGQPLDDSRLALLAQTVGLDGPTFARCVADPGVATQVATDTAEARQPGNDIRPDNLPVFSLNGRRLTGLPDLTTLITTMDAGAKSALAASPLPSLPAASATTPGTSLAPVPVTTRVPATPTPSARPASGPPASAPAASAGPASPPTP